MRACLVATSLMTLSLLSCRPSGPAGLTDADRAALETTSRAFSRAVRAADWSAVAATYTEDAVLMPPNAAVVRGREKIREFFASFPPISDFEVENVEIDGRGDLAYVYGVYGMTITPQGAEPIEDSGKFLEIRLKQEDGSWLLFRDMFNSSVPTRE